MYVLYIYICIIYVCIILHCKHNTINILFFLYIRLIRKYSYEQNIFKRNIYTYDYHYINIIIFHNKLCIYFI